MFLTFPIPSAFLYLLKDAYGTASVAEGTAPDLYIAVDDIAFGLFAEGVLVDGVDFVVAEEIDCEIVELCEVASDEHVGCE